MMKAVWSTVTTAAAVVTLSAVSATSVYAQAASATGAVNMTVNVAARAKLTLGAASIAFADADPDTTPTLTSPGLSVDVKARTSGTVTLTVLASNDFTSATSSIPITNLTWTTASAGFSGGTGNKTTPVTVGSWAASGTQTGSLVFSLPNSWTYATGVYATTLNYTLSAP